METKTIALSSLLTLATLGNVFFLYKGTTYRAAIAQPDGTAAKLAGPAVAPFVTKATEAGASGEIECGRNRVSRPDGTLVALLYCTGGSGGFLIGNTLANALITEVKTKLPGVTRDEVRLLIDEAGDLWATKIETGEPE